MAKRDFYEVLGVKRDATDAQIRSAYRNLVRKYHPDVNKAPGAAERFKEATEAYEVVSDAQKRDMYDRFGHAGLEGGPFPGGARTYTWRGGGAQEAPVGFEEIFGGFGSRMAGMGLDEILQALGGGRRSPKAQPRQPGRDLEYHLTLDFLEAIRGTTATLRLERQDASGTPAGESIAVRIPAGVREGSRVRVRGKGGEGPGGRGDLYIITHLREHPYFRREGDDVYVDAPISLAEAALGAKIDVPTVDGMTTVTVPPGTRSGRRLRLRGKGVASPGRKERGDQYVVIRIVPPPKVSARGAELLREFDAVERFNPRADVPWK